MFASHCGYYLCCWEKLQVLRRRIPTYSPFGRARLLSYKTKQINHPPSNSYQVHCNFRKQPKQFDLKPFYFANLLSIASFHLPTILSCIPCSRACSFPNRPWSILKIANCPWQQSTRPSSTLLSSLLQAPLFSLSNPPSL